jgi:uncharacterized membrane protein
MRLRIPVIYVLLGLVLAGLIHIVAVLMLPMLAPKNAWSRLTPLGLANAIIVLPPPALGHETMPMMAPDARYAFCRFNLGGGPVRLRAAVPDDLWLIAFYTKEGDNFYTVLGTDLQRGQVDLIVATEDQAVAEEGADAPEDSDEVVVVKSPVNEGIAMIRAPLAGASHATRAEEALKATYCGPYSH